MISVKIDNKLNAQLRTLKDGKVHAATTRAINQSMTSTVARAAKEISSVYNIKSSDIKKILRVIRATRTTMQGTVFGKSKPVSLYVYKGRQIKAGISVAVQKGSRKIIPGAFIQTMRSGYTSSWKRVGKQRLPLKEQLGPTIPFLLNSDEFRETIAQHANEALQKNIKHEIEYEINKKGTV